MRISTVTQNLRIDNSITSIQRRIADAQLQISTQKKSQVYSGFSGQDVRLLISLKEQRTSVESYVDSINNTKVKTATIDAALVTFRSEEHTSELPSLMRISYAVFCLKKKNNRHT